MKQLLIAAVLAVVVVSFASTARAADNADRMKWFNEARYGLFIHWGLYAVPAGEWNGVTKYDEWIQLEAKIRCSEYDKLAAKFNPTKFDAKAWARLAKDAGMKYVVITAKHHDGFSLFDSKLSDFDIVDATPYKKDPMKELADAVRAEGLTFCFYYSIPDWHDPNFPAKYSMRGGFHGNPNDAADIEKYNAFMKGQVKELLTNYGPIGILWFDGGGSFNRDDALRAKLVHAQEIIDMIHELQPNCLVNNRLGLPADYGTPEQKIPGEALKSAFEVCMTVNDHGHWGYNKHDTKFKSVETLVRNIADIASKGGNYLLNVGPTAEGEIRGPEAERLIEVGKWMKTNGESIYGTTGSPLEAVPQWGRVTQKGKTFYLHVFEWPSEGKLPVPGLPSTPKKAFLLGDESKRELTIDIPPEEVMTIAVPERAPDPINTVIVVETE